MADGVTFNLEGLDELLGKFSELSEDVQYRGGRFALRKAANLVAEAVKSNALSLDDPVTTENISKNVAVRWSGRTFKSTGDLKFRVGILGGARATGKEAEKSRRKRRRQGIASLGELGEIAGAGAGNPGGDTFYWRFLEFGTEHARAHPFMRKALSDNVQEATAEFVKHYPKAIERAIKRAGKKK